MRTMVLIFIVIIILVSGCESVEEVEHGSTEARVQTECPYGEVNDPYPGKCGRYIDENDNGICDNSEPST